MEGKEKKTMGVAIVLMWTAILCLLVFMISSVADSNSEQDAKIAALELVASKMAGQIEVIINTQSELAVNLSALKETVDNLPQPPGMEPSVCCACGQTTMDGVYFQHTGQYVCGACLRKALWFYWHWWYESKEQLEKISHLSFDSPVDEKTICLHRDNTGAILVPTSENPATLVVPYLYQPPLAADNIYLGE